MPIIKIYKQIENILLAIRDFFWKYPDRLFFDKNSFVNASREFYLKSRPFSHFIANLVIAVVVLMVITNDISAVLRIDTNTLIEGVIVGEDENGDVQTVDFINPLIVTNMQLKRDISELVYEPLFKVNQDNSITNILAENVADTGQGKVYRIKLKEGIKWHDGEELTSDDVVATFNLLETLEFGKQTSSVYSKAATKIEIEKIDDYRFEFALKEKESVIPNFFEVVSFKILPEHLLSEINSNNIIYPNPRLNRSPVGTGPFIVKSLAGEEISLNRNLSYHDKVAKLQKIVFRLYESNARALSDLRTGQIHTLIGLNSDSIQQAKTLSNLSIYRSNVLYNQYWALYFNLNESGKEVLKQKGVRQAIEYAIDKEFLVESLAGEGVLSEGPIPRTSFAYTDGISRRDQSKDKAIELLSENGWSSKNDEGYLVNESGETLEIDLLFVQNVDRAKVAKLIQSDLKEVGIKLNLISKTISEVNNDHVLPSFFDVLLYGVSTFIDPDRYELFHSSQIGYPNLNISGYVSNEKKVIIEQGEKKTPPEVDYVLEKGRALIDESDRKEEYIRFQEIVLDETPVIYLYHPVYNYIANKRVKGVYLTNMTSLEDRFNSVTNWYIEV